MEGYRSPPSAGPRVVGKLEALAVGAYTDIIAIYGPSEVSPGEYFEVDIVVRNLYTEDIYIALTGQYDSAETYPSPEYSIVSAGLPYTFTTGIVMPNSDITLKIWSWYWTGTEWVQDDYEAVTIKRKTLTPQFRSFSLSDYSKV